MGWGGGLVRMNLLWKSPKLKTDRFLESPEDAPFLGGPSYWSGVREGPRRQILRAASLALQGTSLQVRYKGIPAECGQMHEV